MGNELIGILMAAGGSSFRDFENQVGELQAMSVEERTKYMIIKSLDESYRNKTFREVAECMVKDRVAFEPEQKMIADKIKCFFTQHNPPDFICYFNAYNADNAAIRDQNGQQEIGMNEKIAPFITARQNNGIEYDCIDMLIMAQCICCA